MTSIRRATAEDIERCDIILNHAKDFLRSQGLSQWQWGYPSRQNIERDTEAGELYVAYDEQTGEVLGSAMITLGGEPNYDNPLRGAWLTDSPNNYQATYACIHRVTCAPEHRGKGVATSLMTECERQAREAGKRSCRVETHPHNAGMRHIAEKMGYVHCCDIASNHDRLHGRVAYEKLLDPADVADNPADVFGDDVEELQERAAAWWEKRQAEKGEN